MKRAFINPHLADMKRGLLDVLIWAFGGYKDESPLPPPPIDFSFPNPSHPLHLDKPYATWINHSTFYVHTAKGAFLTDPIWSERCSPSRFFGPKRQIKPPIGLSELQDLKGVLISHDHYDHLDYETVKTLNSLMPSLHWIVPLRVEKWFHKHFPKAHVTSLGWGETAELLPEWKVTAVPAQHFSGRHLFRRNETLWSGYILDYQDEKSPHRLYFAGDTGYNPIDFKEIGKSLRPSTSAFYLSELIPLAVS